MVLMIMRYSFFIAFTFCYLISFGQENEKIVSNHNNQVDGFIEVKKDEYGKDSFNKVDSTFIDKIDQEWLDWLYNLSSLDSIHNSVKARTQAGRF